MYFRVLAKGSALVADRVAQDAGARRFVGRFFDPTVGLAGGWPALEEPTVVPAFGLHGHEYRRALMDGDLWPADQATADAVGVKFDPDFGGDFPHKG